MPSGYRKPTVAGGSQAELFLSFHEGPRSPGALDSTLGNGRGRVVLAFGLLMLLACALSSGVLYSAIGELLQLP